MSFEIVLKLISLIFRFKWTKLCKKQTDFWFKIFEKLARCLKFRFVTNDIFCVCSGTQLFREQAWSDELGTKSAKVSQGEIIQIKFLLLIRLHDLCPLFDTNKMFHFSVWNEVLLWLLGSRVVVKQYMIDYDRYF